MNRKLRVIALSFVAFISLNTTKAQTNYDFDTWSGSPESATGWSDLNVLTTLGFTKDTSVVKVTGQTGFAAQLHPIALKKLGLGNIYSSIIVNKDAYTNKPDSVSFYYKYKPGNNAAASITIVLTLFNTNTNKADTVAKVKFLPSKADTVKTFTLKKLQLIYLLGGSTTPDSLKTTIGLVAGDSTGKAARLTIDDIRFSGTHKSPSGIVNAHKTSSAIIVYPGIADNAVNFDFADNTQQAIITLYDLTGRVMKVTCNNAEKCMVSVSDFTNGYYLYQITDRSNNELKTGKFVVNHQ